MRSELLAEADRIVRGLPAGRRESVREIVIDAMRRGALPPTSRAFLDRATGSPFLSDVLSRAVEEHASAPDEPALQPGQGGPVAALPAERVDPER